MDRVTFVAQKSATVLAVSVHLDVKVFFLEAVITVRIIVFVASYTVSHPERKNKNSTEGVIAPAGAKVTGATIRMWLLNKFISFLAVLGKLGWKQELSVDNVARRKGLIG